MRIDKRRSKKLQDQDAYVQLTLADDELCIRFGRRAEMETSLGCLGQRDEP